MDELKLVADRRELTGRKVGQLRRQGLVPVVVYGNVKQPVNLQVDIKMLERTLHAGGDTRVVEVTVNDGGKHNVLVKNVQREPVGEQLHVRVHARLVDAVAAASVFSPFLQAPSARIAVAARTIRSFIGALPSVVNPGGD